jgi:adenylosuccinate synthase
MNVGGAAVGKGETNAIWERTDGRKRTCYLLKAQCLKYFSALNGANNLSLTNVGA